MGWNDHVNFELLDAIDELIDEGLLDADSDLRKLADLVAHEGFLTPAEAALYERDMHPLLEQLEAIHERQDIEYLVSKDD
jgi:cobyric acid synthase